MKDNNNKYTLLLPTFNRPEDLARLLRFLADQQALFPVIVLDSSSAENQEKNAKTVFELSHKLDIRIECFDSSMSPWEKFWRGSQLVKTQFASLCADDDLVLVSSINPLIRYLEDNPDYSVAHGWYFNFYLNGAFGLTDIVYKGKSIDEEDPIERLTHLFSNYEAITYGVHRTIVLQEALGRMRQLNSLLGRELLGGAIAAISGKIARLPVLYAGRSLAPSAPYVNWHPIEFLLTSVQSLFDEYAKYRLLLLESYTAQFGQPSDAITQYVDLAHLRYLSQYLNPEVVEHLIQGIRQKLPRQDIVNGMWPILTQKQGLAGKLQKSGLLQRIRRNLFPWVRYYHFKKLFSSSSSLFRTNSMTKTGTNRNYEIYNDFVQRAIPICSKNNLNELISVLNLYE